MSFFRYPQHVCRNCWRNILDMAPGTFGGTWADTMRLGSLSAEAQAELQTAFSYCFNLDGTYPS